MEDGTPSRIRKKDTVEKFSKESIITKDNLKITRDMETVFLLMKMSVMKGHGLKAKDKEKGCSVAKIKKFFMMVVGKRVKSTVKVIMNTKATFMRVTLWMIQRKVSALSCLEMEIDILVTIGMESLKRKASTFGSIVPLTPERSIRALERVWEGGSPTVRITSYTWVSSCEIKSKVQVSTFGTTDAFTNAVSLMTLSMIILRQARSRQHSLS